MESRKLGKQPKKHDSRTFKLSKYLKSSLPSPPESLIFSKNIEDWGMMANDTIGNCTAASYGHSIENWTNSEGNKITPSDGSVISFYSSVTGYDSLQTDSLGNNPTDNGAVMLDVLKYAKNTGLAGHTIGAFASCNPKNQEHIKSCIQLFGCCNIGVGLPISAQNQDIWDIPNNQTLTGDWVIGSWGGHCVLVVGYDQEYVYIVTWGTIKKATWQWILTYCDEAYAMMSNDFLKNNITPEGFDLATLQKDINQLI